MTSTGVCNPLTNRIISVNSRTYNDLVSDWSSLYHYVFPRTSPRVNLKGVYSESSSHYHVMDSYVETIFRHLPKDVNDTLDSEFYASNYFENLTAEEYQVEYRKHYLNKISVALSYYRNRNRY